MDGARFDSRVGALPLARPPQAEVLAGTRVLRRALIFEQPADDGRSPLYAVLNAFAAVGHIEGAGFLLVDRIRDAPPVATLADTVRCVADHLPSAERWDPACGLRRVREPAHLAALLREPPLDGHAWAGLAVLPWRADCDTDLRGVLPIIDWRRLLHAVAIVGYSTREQAFRVLNSAGPTWGVLGRAWLRLLDADELWARGRLELLALHYEVMTRGKTIKPGLRRTQ